VRGFERFLGKEVTEILRTWRIWVLPGVLLFFAVSGPVLALLTPQLLKSLGTGSQGVVITLPTPTFLDSYAQWVKNLGQIGVFLLIGVSAGLVAGERTRGTAILVLTKPVSRGGFVVAKYIAHSLLLIAATALGTLVTWGLTRVLFDEAPPARLLESTGAWIAFALMLLAVMVLLSSVMSTLAAVGSGVGVFALLGILNLWGPAVRYTFVGLLGAPAQLLQGTARDLTWPIATAIAAVPLLIASAVAAFRRVEI
jgi:ABC-2 type transport system permease protein